MSAAGATDRVRSWVQELLLREGAVLEAQAGGALYACLPLHLQQRLALPEAALLRVCEPAGAGETGLELEAAAMQGCLDLALPRGRVAAARLPPATGRHEHFQAHAAEALQVDNAAVRRGEVARRRLCWLVFGFGWAGTADERRTGRVLVAHEPVLGSSSAVTARTLLAALPEAEAIAEVPPRAELERALAAAWPGATAVIRAELEPFAHSARQRQAREERRLAGYYDKLLAEAQRRRGRAEAGVAGPERRAAIQRDRQEKLAQLAERFTIRCEVQLEDLLVVEHETTVAELLIRRKVLQRSVTVAWDPWQHEPMARDCEACGRAGRSFHACDDAVHLVCHACRAARCPVCARGAEPG